MSLRPPEDAGSRLNQVCRSSHQPTNPWLVRLAAAGACRTPWWQEQRQFGPSLCGGQGRCSLGSSVRASANRSGSPNTVAEFGCTAVCSWSVSGAKQLRALDSPHCLLCACDHHACGAPVQRITLPRHHIPCEHVVPAHAASLCSPRGRAAPSTSPPPRA